MALSRIAVAIPPQVRECPDCGWILSLDTMKCPVCELDTRLYAPTYTGEPPVESD